MTLCGHGKTAFCELLGKRITVAETHCRGSKLLVLNISYNEIKEIPKGIGELTLLR